MEQHHPFSSVCVKRRITRIGPQGRREVEDFLLREEDYSLFCDGKPVAELHCMPSDLEQLAVGRLFTMGLLRSAAQILEISIVPEAGCLRVRLRPEAEAPRAPLPGSDVRLHAAQVHQLQQAFETRCDLFRQTGAAHGCALATPEAILLFYEDIARHNALDKLIGAMLLQEIPPDGKVMIFSGRLASDMLAKAVVSGVRLLIAPGAPSLASVVLAEAHAISLLGFVRRDNINIYTCPQRILP